jgi:hypothetical protein
VSASPPSCSRVIWLHFVAQAAQFGLLQIEQFDAQRVGRQPVQFAVNCVDELGEALAGDGTHQIQMFTPQ